MAVRRRVKNILQELHALTEVDAGYRAAERALHTEPTNPGAWAKFFQELTRLGHRMVIKGGGARYVVKAVDPSSGSITTYPEGKVSAHGRQFIASLFTGDKFKRFVSIETEPKHEHKATDHDIAEAIYVLWIHETGDDEQTRIYEDEYEHQMERFGDEKALEEFRAALKRRDAFGACMIFARTALRGVDRARFDRRLTTWVREFTTPEQNRDRADGEQPEFRRLRQELLAAYDQIAR